MHIMNVTRKSRYVFAVAKHCRIVQIYPYYTSGQGRLPDVVWPHWGILFRMGRLRPYKNDKENGGRSACSHI